MSDTTSKWTEAAQVVPAYRPAQLEQRAPCQSGCISGGDTRGWINVVSQRHLTGLSDDEAFEEAWRIITDINPFPAVMGRVCPHPCESGCNRGDRDAPVAINALERFLGDWAIDRGLGLLTERPQPRTESVAVIGAGPSGLSFAYQMARRGYPVSVYEKGEAAGGMLRFGIPDYRLPPPVLDAEIARIEQLGVEIHTGVEIGHDITMDDLRREFDMVYLGVGAQKGRPLTIPGAAGPGVRTAIDFLRDVNSGHSPAIGRRIIVVGGGNTAVDAARTARRLGADVTIVYRRTRAEMPAIESEVDDAVGEGVRLEFLTNPVEILRRHGEVAAVRLQRMQLSGRDSSGRPRPVPIGGSEYEVTADMVLAAVSQEADLTLLPGHSIDGHQLEDALQLSDDLLAGGDLAGPDLAGSAIAQGRRAADLAHATLSSSPLPIAPPQPVISAGEITMLFRELSHPASAPALEPSVALAHPRREVVETITEDQFLAEVERCYSCGLCMGCMSCSMYCTVGAFTPVDDPRPGHYFTMTLDHCLECGKCIEVCPCGYLQQV